MNVIVKCPVCVEEETKSIVYENGGKCSTKTSVCFYDEEGEYHSHDPGIVTQNFRCSNGHKFSIKSAIPCPNIHCDYGKE